MILAIDVGNTTIEIGIIEGRQITVSWRLRTDQGRLADEYGVQICELLWSHDILRSGFDGIVISSVVPAAGRELSIMCNRFFGYSPLMVSEELDLGIQLDVDRPEEIGADRLATAVGAYYTYGGSLIVVDFGTATTFDVISPHGSYIGGVIAPGIRITMDALFDRAALLQPVDLTPPQSIIGTNTSECIKSGFYFGFRSQMEGILHQIKTELGRKYRADSGTQADIKVIATGGLANPIAEDSENVDIVDPDLLLKGLSIIYHRYQKSVASPPEILK